MDAALVPIALGNQDVLNAIENLKKNEMETNTGTQKSDDQPEPQNKKDKKDNTEKENKDEDKKKHVTSETPPTLPNKGSLVIVKHGIKRKQSIGWTYKCSQCNKQKSSTRELNKHY